MRTVMRSTFRIAFLYGGLSQYFLSCLRALKEDHEVQLLLIHWPVSEIAPYEHSNLDWIDHIHERRAMSVDDMRRIVQDFDPHVIYLTGWMDKSYLKVARECKSRALIVAGCDTQWHGTMRQHVAKLASRWLLHRTIDIMWVAGERQRQTARHFGYTSASCWDGVYACDWHAFAHHAGRGLKQREKAFLFTGRYAPVKGIDILAQAYKVYRTSVEKPWKLICAGTGSYRPPFWDQKGIEHLGFVQPEALPELMGRCAAFVLPSIEEPWGVVIHEAATAGMPLICTDACGATVHLLHDDYNGYTVDAGSVDQLTQALIRMSTQSGDSWEQMSQHSFELSKAYTPSRWADTLVIHSRAHPKLRLRKAQAAAVHMSV